MRNLFKLTLLAAALSLSGCGSFAVKPTELTTTEPQSQYDDQIQDALGSQKFVEAQMLYQRRFNDFQSQIEELEKRRSQLDAAMNARAYEGGLSEAPASTSEAGRINEYQDASRASQARVAEVASKLTIQQSLIENRRDKDLLEADSRAAKKIADIEMAAAKDRTGVEDRINQDIEGRRSIDSAARLADSKRFDEQRFTLALANAEAERLAKARLDDETLALGRIQAEATGRINQQDARISELKRQIAEIEGQMLKTRLADDSAIRNQESKVSFAQGEVNRLGKISQDLKSSTVAMQAGYTPQATDYVQAKNAELSRAHADADVRKAQRIADVNSQAAREKNDIISRARTELASLSVNTEMAKANIVAPVVTGRSVYSGNAAPPKPSPAPAPVVRTQPTLMKPAPVLTINRFEPKVDATPLVIGNDEIGGSVLAGGNRISPPGPSSSAAPLLVAPKTRSVYDVFYVYKDEGTWNKFQQFLKAYGITDFEPTHDNRAGEFFIYCGRYYDQDQAAARVAFLNKTTSTANVKVRETQVPL